jgi:hypothetical protein
MLLAVTSLVILKMETAGPSKVLSTRYTVSKLYLEPAALQKKSFMLTKSLVWEFWFQLHRI